MTHSECRATDEGYLLNGEHYDECAEDGCAGCFPCVPKSEGGDPLGHCTARKRCTEHLPPDVLTCPRCVGKTRKKLARIVTLTQLLSAAAIEAARVDSEALNLAGPTPEVGTWAAANVLACYAGDFNEDDPNHPYLVLGRWELMLREDYGPATTGRVTVNSAADYLDGQLGRLAQDRDQDFAEFTRDSASCLGHIEAVLAVAKRRETGAPCPTCAKPAPRLVMHRGLMATADEWRCPNDKEHRWTDAEYRLRVGTDYLDHADRLTASQIRHRFRVTEGTVRGWAAKETDEGEPLVRKRGKNHDGLMLYDVADVQGVRDGTRKEAPRKAG